MKEGASVIVNSIHSETGEAVADKLNKAGGNAIAIRADVSKIGEVLSFKDQVFARFGAVDILVNNAGTNIPGSALETTEEEWDETMGTNLKSVFLMSKTFGAEMIRRKAGSIINISSVQGIRGRENRLAYCVSKAGVNMLTQGLAVEWSRFGVRVNAIAPGTIKTDRFVNFVKRGLYSQDSVEGRIPLGRIGEPADIAKVATFLASDDSSYLTGAVVVADGGWSTYLAPP